MAFVHTLFVMPALGSPAAITGGATAMAPGAAAFFVLVAHTGVGLQLRRERLKERAQKRRVHLTTATLIVALVALHVIFLRR
jgi:cytochrome b561